MSRNTFLATFAGGCFWCTEAIFQRLHGVIKVTPGYSGGDMEGPTYEEVASGKTGHAEVIQVEYDTEKIKYEELLEVFFATHDPTTLNRQGADIGTQYRSAVFYHDQKQKDDTEEFIKKLTLQNTFKDPIVTEVSKFKKFYPAEDYYLNYYNSHKNQLYCKIIITPKLKKLEKLQKKLS